MMEFFDQALAMNRLKLIDLQSGIGVDKRKYPIARAKDFLSLREQFRTAREAVMDEHPVVYGVELEGQQHHLNAI